MVSIFQASISLCYSLISVSVIVRLTNQDLLIGFYVLLITTLIFSKLFILALVVTSVYFFRSKSIVSTGVLNKFMTGGALRYQHL